MMEVGTRVMQEAIEECMNMLGSSGKAWYSFDERQS